MKEARNQIRVEYTSTYRRERARAGHDTDAIQFTLCALRFVKIGGNKRQQNAGPTLFFHAFHDFTVLQPSRPNATLFMRINEQPSHRPR